MSWWLLPREDFSTSVATPWMQRLAPEHPTYVIFSDAEKSELEGYPADFRFAVIYSRDWYQQLQIKWTPGPIYGTGEAGGNGGGVITPGAESAYVGFGHCDLLRGRWVHFVVTWDEEANDYRLYINGTLVQTATRTVTQALIRQKNSGTLWAGHPLFGYGELAFYEEPLAPEQCLDLFAQSSPSSKEDAERWALIHCGKSLPSLNWNAENEWKLQIDLPMSRRADMDSFQVQGLQHGIIQTTDQGIQVRSSPIHGSKIAKPETWDSSKEPWDPAQGYLWLKNYFCGDCAIEFEFLSAQRHGLALLLSRAAALQGEDFLKHQALRQTGAMTTVCWDKVRNYHWEYYRQMEDCRNDVASHVLVKNPYLRPLAYQDMSAMLEVGTWHRLQWIHEENRIRGAINGQTVFDVQDDPFRGFGPVFRTGTFGLRAMWDTDITYRNLKVWVKPDSY